MFRRIRSRLRSLPISDSEVFSLRFIISRLICISEPSPQVQSRIATIDAALDKLSDAELDRHTMPVSLDSVSEAVAYMRHRGAESSEYLWEQKDYCLFLVAKGELAKSREVPGVAFEFLTRTGPSTWVLRRVPDPLDLLGHAMEFERNELTCDSQRPVQSQICLQRNSDHGRMSSFGRAINKLAATLLA